MKALHDIIMEISLLSGIYMCGQEKDTNNQKANVKSHLRYLSIKWSEVLGKTLKSDAEKYKFGIIF